MLYSIVLFYCSIQSLPVIHSTLAAVPEAEAQAGEPRRKVVGHRSSAPIADGAEIEVEA